jgi:hypothetical protein
MQRSAYGLIVLLTLAAIPLSARAAPAQADRQANCIASVDAAVSHVSWRGHENGGAMHRRVEAANPVRAAIAYGDSPQPIRGIALA